MEFECSGLWWAPSEPENKVLGTLSFSREEGCAIELTFEWDSPFERNASILHGMVCVNDFDTTQTRV